jgi:hypothetical protein
MLSFFLDAQVTELNSNLGFLQQDLLLMCGAQLLDDTPHSHETLLLSFCSPFPRSWFAILSDAFPSLVELVAESL